MQGWRKNHEDAHIAHHFSEDCHLFGVFDGHGGPEVARFCSRYMPQELERESGFREGRYDDSLVTVFHKMDERMRSPEGLAELEALSKDESGGAAEDEEGEDTYEMLRRLVAMQRHMGQQAGGGSGGDAQANGSSSSGDLGEALDPALTVQAGCTAVVALIKGRRLWVANAGDSRAVLCRGRSALAMSEDHKPASAGERARIVAAGGFLSEIGGITRVNGNLNLSRAIGDLRYKTNSQLAPKDQIITAEPDVRSVEIDHQDRFLLLACDGVWDVMTNQQVVDFVCERLDRGRTPPDICCELLDACLATNPREARGVGCDNMTAALVLLQQRHN